MGASADYAPSEPIVPIFAEWVFLIDPYGIRCGAGCDGSSSESWPVPRRISRQRLQGASDVSNVFAPTLCQLFSIRHDDFHKSHTTSFRRLHLTDEVARLFECEIYLRHFIVLDEGASGRNPRPPAAERKTSDPSSGAKPILAELSRWGRSRGSQDVRPAAIWLAPRSHPICICPRFEARRATSASLSHSAAILR